MDNFFRKLEKYFNKKNISLLIVCIIMLLSFGYAAFNSNLNVSGFSTDVRIREDIRITGIRTSSFNNASSSYEDYNKTNIQVGVTLPSATSEAVYSVDITNLGNVEMGILSINNLPDNLSLEVLDYEMNKALCQDIKCTLGMTKTIRVKIKYKENGFNSSNTSYNLKLDFDFQRMYTVTYNTKEGSNKTDKAINNGTYKLDFNNETQKPTSMAVKMNDQAITNYTYTYENGVLTIPDVSGDIVITNSYIDYLRVSGNPESEETQFFNQGIKRNEIESITFKNSKAVPISVVESFDISQDNTGNIMAYYMDEDSNGLYELYIGQDGGVKANPDSSFLFKYMTNLKSIDLTYFNTDAVTNMNSLFNYCSSLTSIDLSNFNTSKVTDISYMFSVCSILNSLDLSMFDTSNVVNMRTMFWGCEALTTLSLSNFDTSKVTLMIAMFYNCNKLSNLNITSFDTSNVTSMNCMFYNCNNLSKINTVI